jgi:hypothetical protein
MAVCASSSSSYVFRMAVVLQAPGLFWHSSFLAGCNPARSSRRPKGLLVEI